MTAAVKMARQVRMESRNTRRARKLPGYTRGGGVTFEQYWNFIQKDRAEEAKRRKEREAEEDKRRKERAKEHEKRMEEREAKRRAEAAELRAEHKKRMEEQEKEAAELRAEHKKYMEEREAENKKRWADAEKFKKESEKRSKELDKRMGDLTNRFGEVSEHLVRPGIVEKFNKLGYHFDASSENFSFEDKRKKISAEIDIILENLDFIIAVEVKTKPKVQDIEHHEKRLEILRYYRSKKNDHRKIQGAIAGAVFDKDVKKAVIAAGMYVIGQSGDTMKIEIPKGFVAREW